MKNIEARGSRVLLNGANERTTMPVINVYNIKKEKVREIELPDEVFDVQVKEPVLHQVVTMQLAQRRSGNASTKNRSAVSGGGRKPWRQKGTGRARVGSTRSPLWRHGGVIFGPLPKDYFYKVPKAIRRLALKMALSSKYQADRLLVLDDFPMEKVKTKVFVSTIKALELESALFLVNEDRRQLHLSARNVPRFKVLKIEGLNVYDVLKHEHVVILEDSIGKITERLIYHERNA
jgi:large subunit ribosomal protein L4